MTSRLRIVEDSLDRDGWERMLLGMPSFSLMQTWEYAEAKAATGPWKPVRAVIRDGEGAIAMFQGLSRSIAIAGGGLLWINRGPLVTAEGPAFPDVLALIAEWAASRKWYVRIAPPVSDGSLSVDELHSSGFRLTETSGWCSARVDLSFDEESLRARLDQKWRNCLNKALRADLAVEVSASEEAFSRYRADLQAMLEAKPFPTTVTPDFLSALQRRLPENRKMIVVTATHENRRVGANLFAMYGDTAEYLSGCVGSEGRSLNAGHLLLWNGLTAARWRACRWFDVGGMHPRLTPQGILHFKEGLNGQRYCLEREIESARRDWRSALIRWRVDAARASRSGVAK